MLLNPTTPKSAPIATLGGSEGKNNHSSPSKLTSRTNSGVQSFIRAPCRCGSTKVSIPTNAKAEIDDVIFAKFHGSAPGDDFVNTPGLGYSFCSNATWWPRQRSKTLADGKFESISEAITQGSDIIPKIHAMCVFDPPRRVADTEQGESLRHEIAALELLLRAYEENVLPERTPGARESLRI